MTIPREIFKDADAKTTEKIISILKNDSEHAYSTTDIIKALYPDLGVSKEKSAAVNFMTAYQVISYISDLLDKLVTDKKLIKKIIDASPYYMLAEG